MESLIFDLLVDIMMPGQNGLDFLKEIRKTSQMPVLMLTAMSDPEDRLDGLEIGADDYMTKPFEPRELLLRIQNILKRFTSNVIETTENDETRFGPFSFNIKSSTYIKIYTCTLNNFRTKVIKRFCKSQISLLQEKILKMNLVEISKTDQSTLLLQE